MPGPCEPREPGLTRTAETGSVPTIEQTHSELHAHPPARHAGQGGPRSRAIPHASPRRIAHRAARTPAPSPNARHDTHRTDRTPRPRRARCAGFLGSLCVLLGLYTPIADACPADYSGDGIIDNSDIGLFVQVYLAGDPAADHNADGVLDNGDIAAFVSDFLWGCRPEYYRAQANSDAGDIILTAGGTKSYAPERRYAKPGVKAPLTGDNTHTLLAAGDNGSGGTVLIYYDNTRLLTIDNDGTTDYSWEMDSGRDSAGNEVYPTDVGKLLTTMIHDGVGGDDDTMYEPKAAVCADGLVVVANGVHEYDSGDRSLNDSWNTYNRVALAFKNLGDPTWTTISDSPAPANPFTTPGAPWMLGRPRIYDNGQTMLLGWTNYQWKTTANTANGAYLSKFVKNGSAWTHSVTVRLKRDTTSLGERHYHTVETDYDGQRLRVFLFVGDSTSFNYIQEFSRSDLNIGHDATPIPDSDMADASNSSSWTDHGIICGGDTDEGTGAGRIIKDGYQPTSGLVIDGKMHILADECVPAVTRFDISGPAGSGLDDGVGVYLNTVNGGANIPGGYLALTGDVNNYANPTMAAAIVAPSASYTNDGNITRIAKYDGQGWFTIAQDDITNKSGLGIGPDGAVYIGGQGVRRIDHGQTVTATPVISSVAATNLLSDAPVRGLPIAGRVTDSTVTPESEGISLPHGIDETLDLVKVEPVLAADWTSRLTYRHAPAPADRVIQAGTTGIAQVRFWVRALGDQAVTLQIKPMAHDTANAMHALQSDSTPNGILLHAGITRFAPETWVPYTAPLNMTESIPQDFAIALEARMAQEGSDYCLPSFYFIYEGFFVQDRQRIFQRTGPGESLPDTDLTWNVRPQHFPLTIHGVTPDEDATHQTSYLKHDALLLRYYSDQENYIDLTRDIDDSRIGITPTINGITQPTATLTPVEWAKATPVSIRITKTGNDLLFQASVYANQYNNGTTIPDAGTLGFTEIRMEGDSDQQGVLQVFEIEAGA